MTRKIIIIFLNLALIFSCFPVTPAEASHRPVIIFVPGIMGTELWIDRPDDLAWFDIIDDKYLNYDNRNKYPLEIGDPLGWRGSAARDVDSIDLNFYGDLQEYFEDGYRLYAFPYDWRRPNEENALELEKEINRIIRKEGVSKVNIVAHSMGGLVSKKYILNTKGKNVDKFISLGTPYFGAPVGFTRLMKGFVEHGITLKGADIAQSIPSVYELLPNSMYFNSNDTSYLGELDTTVKPQKKVAYSYQKTKQELKNQFRDNYIDSAESFHQEMTQQVGKYVNFYRIIGDSKPTVGFVYRETYLKYNGGRSGTFSKAKRWITADVTGDGTVPVAGAARGSERTWFVSDEHTKLTGNNDVLDAVNEILHGRKVHIRTKPKEPNGLKITIYDASEKQFLTERNELSNLFASTISMASQEYTFQPNIQLTFPDGSRFEYKDGRVVQDPSYVQVRNFDSSIEIVVPEGDYKVSVSGSGAESQVGMLVSKIENGVNTQRIDYQELDLTNGTILSELHDNFSLNQVGLDIDGDHIADQFSEAIESELVNETILLGEYDNETPPSDPQDPPNPGTSDGNIDISIEGTEGSNQWFVTPVTITASTTIEIPREEVVPEDGGTDTDSQGDGGQTSEEEITEPVLSIQVNDEVEQETNSISYDRDGKHSVTVYAKDNEGNILGQATKEFKIDNTKPELQTQVSGVQGENGWLRSDAEVSVGAFDETSKLAKVDFSLDSLGLLTYSSPHRVTTEGYHSIYAEAMDNASNEQVTQQSFKIDKTKPVIQNVYLQDEYYWDQEFPIHYEVQDAISGVGTVTASINNRPVQNGGVYRFTEPGWHTYKIQVKDKSGWVTTYETRFEVYIPAKIRFSPTSLQLDHGNGMATNYVELPTPFTPEKINFGTLQLNRQIVHVQDEKYGYVQDPINDSDENGIMEMMFKYLRESLIPIIIPGEQVDEKWKKSHLTVFGEWGEYHLKGYSDIRTVNSGYVAPPPDTTRPTITFSPENNSVNQSIDIIPYVTLSETVTSPNGQALTDLTAKEAISFTDSNGFPEPFTTIWNKNTNTIYIYPSKQLKGSSKYTVRVNDKSLSDLSGNPSDADQMHFSTQSYSVNHATPLPYPIIELEENITQPELVESQPAPTPIYTSLPILNTAPEFGNGISTLTEEEFTDVLQGAEEGLVTVSSKEEDNKIALTNKQVSELLKADKSVELKFDLASITLHPRSISINEGLDTHVILGVEELSTQKFASLKKKPLSGGLFVSEEAIHLSVEGFNSKQESKFEGVFQEPVSVSIPVTGLSKIAARKGLLQIARFNEVTGSWELYKGNFDKSTNSFTFKTNKFSNWTYVVKSNQFSDTKSHWAHEDIQYLSGLGVVSGVTEGKFAPNRKVTKAEFLSMVVNSLQMVKSEDKIPFVDVNQKDRFFESIQTAYAAGIVKGLDATHLGPNDVITREQMATILYNALQASKTKLSKGENKVKIIDSTSISPWAARSVEEMIDMGLMSGIKQKNGYVFAPLKEATRAEAAKVLKKALFSQN